MRDVSFPYFFIGVARAGAVSLLTFVFSGNASCLEPPTTPIGGNSESRNESNGDTELLVDGFSMFEPFF